MSTSTGRRTVRANGVDICLQTHGDPAHPAVLLISGASTSMDMWPAPLCERLAEGGRYVVRYDHRDTGESTNYGAGAATYTIADLTDDAAAVLQVLDVEQAHVVGMSMGGVIGQLLALCHRHRVSTLTLVSTTPAFPPDPERELPSMSPADLEAFGAVERPDWTDRESVVEHLVASERVCAARSVEFDDDAVRRTTRLVVDRSRDVAAMENHFALADPDLPTLRLSQIGAPTLVVHGDEDPVFPVAHGEALADEIPGARLLTLRQLGHEVPPRIWDELVEAVLQHTGRNPAGD